MDPVNHTPIGHLLPQPKQSVPMAPSKESEPLCNPSTEAITLEEHVEHEVQDEEVKEFVQVHKEHPEVPPDLKQIGVKATSAPKFTTTKPLKIPLDDAQIVAGLHAPITSSVRWLATLATYILAQAHVQLKVVHGKVVRIFKK